MQRKNHNMIRSPLAWNINIFRDRTVFKALVQLLAILLLIIPSSPLAAHTNDLHIEGYITSRKDDSPIAFVNIYDHTTRSGTITNQDGYFSMPVASFKDSISISFIGYTSIQLVLHSGQYSYRIRLEENSQLLDEIVFTYREDPYLYELLNACRRKARSFKRNVQSRAYFEQKSWKDDQQVELVEGFYNATLENGYDLQGLELKAGRFALQPSGNRYFITLENSGAVLHRFFLPHRI